MNPGVSILVFILVALLLLSIILLIVNLHKVKLRREDLPVCERTEILEPKLRTMLRDLASLSEKTATIVFPQVSLGSILRTKPSIENAGEWDKMLVAETVDFALCDPETARTRLIVMHGENLNPQRKERLAFVERACESAQIPVLVVRDYNLSGLENALMQKLAPPRRGKAAPSELPPEAATATA